MLWRSGFTLTVLVLFACRLEAGDDEPPRSKSIGASVIGFCRGIFQTVSRPSTKNYVRRWNRLYLRDGGKETEAFEILAKIATLLVAEKKSIAPVLSLRDALQKNPDALEFWKILFSLLYFDFQWYTAGENNERLGGSSRGTQTFLQQRIYEAQYVHPKNGEPSLTVKFPFNNAQEQQRFVAGIKALGPKLRAKFENEFTFALSEGSVSIPEAQLNFPAVQLKFLGRFSQDQNHEAFQEVIKVLNESH